MQSHCEDCPIHRMFGTPPAETRKLRLVHTLRTTLRTTSRTVCPARYKHSSESQIHRILLFFTSIAHQRIDAYQHRPTCSRNLYEYPSALHGPIAQSTCPPANLQDVSDTVFQVHRVRTFFQQDHQHLRRNHHPHLESWHHQSLLQPSQKLEEDQGRPTGVVRPACDPPALNFL